LVLGDDAANANWGGEWRMPTLDEWKALEATVGVPGYTWTWCDGSTTKYQGSTVAGWQVTCEATEGTIFLPSGGYRDHNNFVFKGSNGEYWSSSLRTESPTRAWVFSTGPYREWDPEFITDVMVIGNADKTALNELESNLVSQGWTAIDKDLNAGCTEANANCIHLLYKTKSSKGSSGTPITTMYLKIGPAPESVWEYYDDTYYLTPCQGSDRFVNTSGNLNTGVAGDPIYLYYAKAANPDNVVTSIFFSDSTEGSLNGIDSYVSLNSGTGNTGETFYMHVVRDLAKLDFISTFTPERYRGGSVRPVKEE
jgi:hypothetical protein